MKPREILAKAQASPHNLHFGEFVRLVEAYGFVLKRTRGSHRLYSREQVPLVNLQEARGRAKARTKSVNSWHSSRAII
jgi:hypothetical protein